MRVYFYFSWVIIFVYLCFVLTVTFTGSIVAFAKLQGLVPSKEVSLPGKNVWNSVALGASLYFGKMFFDFACVGAVGDAVGEFLTFI